MEVTQEANEVMVLQLQIDAARDEFLSAQQRIAGLSGVRRFIGPLLLKRARATAEGQGILFVNGRPISPRAVTPEYFSSLEDDFFEPTGQ